MNKSKDVSEPRPAAKWTRVAWILLAAALVFLGVIALKMAKSPAAPAAPAAAAAPAANGAAGDMGRILGRWLRPDGGYVLELSKVLPDGRIEAAYFNPNPIHVERATAETGGDGIRIYVELRDRNYEGNFYRLRYDPQTDRLTGQYHQLTMQQVYDIEFERLSQQ